MELRYASRELERQCTQTSHMQRTLGAQRAKALRLRLSQLRSVDAMSDLLLLPGRWEELQADRAGQWSGRLTGNWRIIVQPDAELITVVIVQEIVDYH